MSLQESIMSLQEVPVVVPTKRKRTTTRKMTSEKYLKYKAILDQDFQMRLTGRYHKLGRYRLSFKTPIPPDPSLAVAYFTNDLEDAFAEGKFRRTQATWRTINLLLVAEAKASRREFSEY